MDISYSGSLSINVDQSNPLDCISNFAGAGGVEMGVSPYPYPPTSQKHSPSLDNLFSNRDVLARRLKNRPDRDDLIDRNILPAHAHSSAPNIFDKATQLKRRKTGDILQKKIRARPNRQQLIQRHILSGDSRVDPSLLEKLGKLERQKIADQLNERLLSRPGPIELIQDRILPVESPIQNAIDQGAVEFENTVSPVSSHPGDSPTVSDLENAINTLNCTSPSPPPPQLFGGDAFKNHLKNVSGSTYKHHQQQLQCQQPVHPSVLSIDSGRSSTALHSHQPSQITQSQKENEMLIKSVAKKTRQSKPKVKKLKFHECQPGSTTQAKTNEDADVIDERYKRLLEQQTLYLRLQVMQQNAVMNAIQGNAQSMEAVKEEIDKIITKEQIQGSDLLATGKSIDGKKFDELRVIELRAQLKQRGLLVSGSKAKLVERLTAFEEGKSAPSDFAYSANCFPHNEPSATKNVTSSDLTPVTTVMQVTAFATNSGQTYQVLQTVPQSPPNVMQYQVLPSNTSDQSMAELQLNEVSTLPVVAVTQPNIMTVEESENSESKDLDTSPLSPITSPSAPNTSNNLQFQLTPSQQQTSILLHSGPQIQQASLMSRQRQKVQVYRLPVLTQGECYIHDDTTLSQSLPINSLQYNDTYLVDSLQGQAVSTKHIAYQNSSSNLHSSKDIEFEEQSQFRSRASSDPSSHLDLLRSNSGNNTIDNGKSIFHNQPKMTECASPEMTSPFYDQRQNSKDSSSNYSVKSEAMEDIMDIIGEMSPTGGFIPKAENSVPINHCLFDTSMNYMKVNSQKPQQHQMKSFNSSVPENINQLCSSPSQNFLSSPYTSHSNLNSGLSLGNSNSSLNTLNQSSSTGNIPQRLKQDTGGLSTSPFSNKQSAPSFMNTPMSPLNNSLVDDQMSLDRFPQNNTLSWLDLNMEGVSSSNTPPPANQQFQVTPNNSVNIAMNEFQNVYNNPHAIYGAQNRSQTSIHGSSPKPQDGYISLFDLEGGGY